MKTTGTTLRQFALTGAAIIALCLAPGALPAQTLYVANANNNTIERFTPGGAASQFASTGLMVPYGLAFDAVGNLYAANPVNNTIERFTPGGVASQFAATGLNGPTFLAFQVPEPSTWALLGVGAGVAGFVTLRRRSRVA